MRLVLACAAVLCLLDALAALWTEHDWLHRLGLATAWSVPFVARLQLFLAGIFAALFVAWWPLRALLPPIPLQSTLESPTSTAGILEKLALLFSSYARRAAWAIAILAALRAGLALAAQWPLWLQWRHGGVWGVHDPYFGVDLGFWVFRLPFLSQVHSAIWKLVGVLWLLCIALVIGGELSPLAQRRLRTSKSKNRLPESTSKRAWIGAFGALWFALLAISYVLALFQDALSSQPALIAPSVEAGRDGIEFLGRTLVPSGYSFSSWWVQRPANFVGFVFSGCAAALWVGFATSQQKRSRVRPSRRFCGPWLDSGWTRWLAWGSIGAFLLPGMLSWLFTIFVQRLLVEPDEAWRERRWLQAHIAMQRSAWQLDNIEDVGVQAVPLSSTGIIDIAKSGESMPLWDEQSFYAQLETAKVNNSTGQDSAIAPVTAVSINPYEVSPNQSSPAARRELRAIRVREDPDEAHAAHPRDRVEIFSLSQLEALTESKVGEAAPSNLRVPKLLSPAAPTMLACGLLERSPRWRPKNADGGVPVDSVLRRALWAAHLRAPWVLWKPAVQSDRHLWIQRDVLSRAAQIAPFLKVGGVSPVVVNNQLLWIVDLVATTSHFPGALGMESSVESGPQHQSTFNAVSARDAVKMIVEARSGNTQLFVASARAESDPLLQMWRRAFPGLIRSFVEMPRELQSQRCYPRALLSRQLLWLERYHYPTDSAVETWLDREQWWQVERGGTQQSASAKRIEFDIVPLEIHSLETRVPSGRSSWAWQIGVRRHMSPSLHSVLHLSVGSSGYGRLRRLHFSNRLPPLLAPLNAANPQESDNEANASESTNNQRVKWRRQRGKVLMALIPVAKTKRSPQDALKVHVVMRQSIYQIPSDTIGGIDVSPLWRVLVGDLLQLQRGSGEGATIAQALRDWNQTSRSKQRGLPQDVLRRALRWHEQAEAAAKTGDWARAATLRQREKDVLQSLLKPPGSTP